MSDTDPKLLDRTRDELKMMLDYADRAWKAEEENARRLAARVNLSLTALLALVAGAALKINPSVMFEIDQWARRVSLLIVVVLFVLFSLGSLAYLLGVRFHQARVTGLESTRFLALTEQIQNGTITVGLESFQAAERCFWNTIDAAAALNARNVVEYVEIKRAQKLLLLSLTTLLVAVTMYNAAAIRQRESVMTGVAHDQDNRSQGRFSWGNASRNSGSPRGGVPDEPASGK